VEHGICSGSAPTTLTDEQLRLVLEQSGTPAQIAAATGLSEHQVRLALELGERGKA
jgi:hypothetical protein